jgi:hypothetical protein
MQPLARVAYLSCAGACAALLVLAACASQKEPAQKSIAGIEATLSAAAPEAAKYIPDQLSEVQTQLAALKASFDRHDYAAVVTGAPTVLAAASSLATDAAAKKDQVLRALNDQWTGLADRLPEYVTAIRKRIDFLSKKSSKKLAADIDLDAAKAGVGDAASLWSKAQAAFAAGNLDQAVTTANQVKAKVEAVAAALKLDLAAAPA